MLVREEISRLPSTSHVPGPGFRKKVSTGPRSSLVQIGDQQGSSVWSYNLGSTVGVLCHLTHFL